MSGARGVAAALLSLSLSLTLLPAAWGAPLETSALGSAPAGSFRADLAALPGTGAMLAVAVGPEEAQFFSIDEDGATATKLAAFPLRASQALAPLACARIAALEGGAAALAYQSGAAVRIAVVDPWSGELVGDLQLAADGGEPCVASQGGEFVVSFLERMGGAPYATVLRVTAGGAVTGSPLRYGPVQAQGVALVAAAPAPLLAIADASSLRLFEVLSSLQPLGAVAVSSSAGAVWARDGSVQGLLSTPSGLVRLRAAIADVGGASLALIAGGANAAEVAAADSGDGLLVAALVTSGGAFLLREDTVGSFTTAPQPGMRGAAAAVDGFGLARAVLVTGSDAAPSLRTISAGDADAVAVSVAGPSTVRPLEPQAFTATVRAVRSSITLVGLDVTLPPGWAVGAPSASAALAVGESAAFAFTVTAPAGTPAGSYAIAVTPSALEAPRAPTAVLPVEVLGGAAVSLVGGTGSIDLAPGASTTVSLTLSNTGAAAVVTEVVPASPAGLLVTPPQQAVTLMPGATAQVTFTVRAADLSAPIDGASVSFHVSPSGGGSDFAVDIPARVIGLFEPRLAAAGADISTAPGTTVVLPFALVNTGNLGGLVALTSSAHGAGAEVRGLAPLVFLPPFSRLDLPLTLAVPSTARAGTAYEVSLTAARASDGSPIAGPGALAGFVTRALDFTASVARAASAAPGQEVETTLTLSNAGNGPVSASIEFLGVSGGFSVRVADSAAGAVLVGAFGRVEVPLVVRVPQDALPGSRLFAVSVTATPGGSVEAPLVVDVRATHGLSLAVTAPPAPLVSNEIASASFEFVVSNAGNTPTEVRLQLGAPLLSLSTVGPSGVLPAEQPLTLGAHASLTLRARVAPTFVPGETEASARLIAESTQGDAASASVTFDRMAHDLRVAEVAVLGSNAPGTLHTVSATIANAGPGTAAGYVAVLTSGSTAISRVALPPVSSGLNRLVQFEFVPREADTELTVRLVAPPDRLDRDGGNDALTIHYAVDVAASPGAALPPGAAPAAAASISLLALLGLALTEIGKTTLISSLFLPLYVKLKPDEVLDQYLRGQIHGYIIANPGEHYNAIKDQLGVTNGALAYHLRVLERAELIRAVRDGMYKRFYPVGVKIPKRKRLSPFQAAIVRAVRANPDISQKGLAEFLGVSNQVVNYNVKQLEDANILKVDRAARASKVTLGPDAPPAEDVPPAPAPIAPVQPTS